MSYTIPVSASALTEMKLIYLRLITIKFNSYYQRKGAAASCSVSAADADSHSAALCWTWEALMGWLWDLTYLSVSKPVSRSCRAEILVLSERNLSQAPHSSHSSLSAPCQIHAYLLLMSAVPWVRLVIRHVVAGFCWKNIISRHELSHWFFLSHHWFKIDKYILYIHCSYHSAIFWVFMAVSLISTSVEGGGEGTRDRCAAPCLDSHAQSLVPLTMPQCSPLPHSSYWQPSTAVMRWLVKRSCANPRPFLKKRVSFFFPSPVLTVFFPVFFFHAYFWMENMCDGEIGSHGLREAKFRTSLLE